MGVWGCMSVGCPGPETQQGLSKTMQKNNYSERMSFKGLGGRERSVREAVETREGGRDRGTGGVRKERQGKDGVGGGRKKEMEERKRKGRETSLCGPLAGHSRSHYGQERKEMCPGWGTRVCAHWTPHPAGCCPTLALAQAALSALSGCLGFSASASPTLSPHCCL
jgi:hypothetical protein